MALKFPRLDSVKYSTSTICQNFDVVPGSLFSSVTEVSLTAPFSSIHYSALRTSWVYTEYGTLHVCLPFRNSHPATWVCLAARVPVQGWIQPEATQGRGTPACLGEGHSILMSPGHLEWLRPLGVNLGMFVLLWRLKIQLTQPLSAHSLQRAVQVFERSLSLPTGSWLQWPREWTWGRQGRIELSSQGPVLVLTQQKDFLKHSDHTCVYKVIKHANFTEIHL